MRQVKEILDKAGPIQKVKKIVPLNQLRISFKLQAENGVINISFTLTPETIPKVQRLNISF